MLGSPLAAGVLHRARTRGIVDIALHQLRDYASGRHLQVDDTPYGGGQGMVMMPEPLVAAIEHVAAADRPRRVLLSASGPRFDQARAEAFAALPSLLLVCGRYEGVDERVKAFVDEELSVGDFVLSGGEPAAIAVIDAVVRLLPGALGNAASPRDDSFAHGTPRASPVHAPGRVPRHPRAGGAALRRPCGDRAVASHRIAPADPGAAAGPAAHRSPRRGRPALPPLARMARWLTCSSP